MIVTVLCHISMHTLYFLKWSDGSTQGITVLVIFLELIYVVCLLLTAIALSCSNIMFFLRNCYPIITEVRLFFCQHLLFDVRWGFFF